MGDDLKPMQPWGADGPTIRVGEPDAITGYVPVELSKPKPPGTFLTDLLEDWRREKNPQEYVSGFRARMADIPESDAAHLSWQAGWSDADTEKLEQDRHRQVLEEGREDGYLETRGLLFDAGRNARMNGVAFDKERTEPWQQGWVAADVEIGGKPAF